MPVNPTARQLFELVEQQRKKDILPEMNTLVCLVEMEEWDLAAHKARMLACLLDRQTADSNLLADMDYE